MHKEKQTQTIKSGTERKGMKEREGRYNKNTEDEEKRTEKQDKECMESINNWRNTCYPVSLLYHLRKQKWGEETPKDGTKKGGRKELMNIIQYVRNGTIFTEMGKKER